MKPSSERSPAAVIIVDPTKDPNNSENKIGRFGIGFKSVFAFTSEPRIYDKDFRFKITNFVVPEWIEEDLPNRGSEQTVFVLPFKDDVKEKAFKDIDDKLRKLTYPLLFLNNLEKIEIAINENGEDKLIGVYEMDAEEYSFGNTSAQLITLLFPSSPSEKLWLFSRSIEEKYKISVGFFLDEKGKLKPVDLPVFCFFKTEKKTGLPFVIHAPFQLIGSRENLSNNDHNTKMLNALAELAADSYEYMRDIDKENKGKEGYARLIDENIPKLIPPLSAKDLSSVFREKIFAKFKETKLLPAKNGDDYVAGKNAYLSANHGIDEQFSDEQLAKLTGAPDARWVSLIKDIDDIGLTSMTNADTSNKIENNPGFIKEQSSDWLKGLYRWAAKDYSRTKSFKYTLMFIDNEGNVSAAFDIHDNNILFLPKDINKNNTAEVESCTAGSDIGTSGNANAANLGEKEMKDLKYIRNDLVDDEETRKALMKIGLTEPSDIDHIKCNILPKYKTNGGIDTLPDFRYFFNYYCTCPNDEVNDFIKLIKNYAFILNWVIDSKTNTSKQYRGKASDDNFPCISPMINLKLISSPKRIPDLLIWIHI